MERQVLFNYLSEAQVLLNKYSSYQTEIENEKYRIMFFNRKTLFLILGIALGFILYSFSNHNIISPVEFMKTGSITFGIGILVMRWIVGPILDNKKRQEMKKAALIRFQPYLQEMDKIAIQLDEAAVIPEKYRTLNAVSHLLEYFKNGRADSLKEGINLYEDEMSKLRNHNQVSQIVIQNRKMINQNMDIIRNQKEMIRAQRTTNDLIWFK